MEKYQVLTQEELNATEGGFIITTGAVIGIGLAATGLGAGIYFGMR